MATNRILNKFKKGQYQQDDNTFYEIQYNDGGNLQTEVYSKYGVNLKDYYYKIISAEFCQQPLDLALDYVPGVQLFVDTTIEGSPSLYHRFIRFWAEPGNVHAPPYTEVYGTFEKLPDRVVCTLYEFPGSRRPHECVTVAVVSDPKRMCCVRDYLKQKEFKTWERHYVHQVFLATGGGGPYHVISNNCIHYAVDCWNNLMCLASTSIPRLSYKDVASYRPA